MTSNSIKPAYRYAVHEPSEGAGELRAITVFGPQGNRIGMTQVWNGVTATEMVKDFVEVTTDLIWPGEFSIEEIKPEATPEEAIRIIQGVLEDARTHLAVTAEEAARDTVQLLNDAGFAIWSTR